MNTLLAVRSLPELLNDADPEIRRGVYKSLGVMLSYRREEKAELIRVDSALRGVDLDCVGGGT